MLGQMHEIMMMREQQRNNMRLIRQREQQALRDFERVRANRVLGQQAPVVGGHINNINLPPKHPLPAAAPFPGAGVYGNPQAVPEPGGCPATAELEDTKKKAQAKAQDEKDSQAAKDAKDAQAAKEAFKE